MPHWSTKEFKLAGMCYRARLFASPSKSLGLAVNNIIQLRDDILHCDCKGT